MPEHGSSFVANWEQNDRVFSEVRIYGFRRIRNAPQALFNVFGYLCGYKRFLCSSWGIHYMHFVFLFLRGLETLCIKGGFLGTFGRGQFSQNQNSRQGQDHHVPHQETLDNLFTPRTSRFLGHQILITHPLLFGYQVVLDHQAFGELPQAIFFNNIWIHSS